MRHGLTLIEVLVSLALLTAIITASASWTTIAGHSATTNLEPSRWQRAAEATLDLIHDDIVTGDFQPTDSNGREKREPQAKIIDGDVIIRTRSPSPSPAQRELELEYELDESTRRLQRSVFGATEGRTLLSDVDAFTVQTDEELTRLTVTIQSSRFGECSRSFALP